jgi:cytochrome c-type biogenesis protein CcsB
MATNMLASAMAVFYAGALVLSLVGIFSRRKILEKFGLGLLAVAFVVNTWAIADRWLAAGHPPFKTLYETLVFYPWCVAIVTFVLVALHRLYFLVPFAGGISVIGLLYALYKPDMEIVSLPPALQSGWFIPHVVTYLVAYASLFASFALAVLALAQPYWRARVNKLKTVIPGSEFRFEQYAHQSAVFGIVTLTLGLVMGSIWGKVAWGEYWGWDPKENWSLVCWLAYMIYLHLRLIAGWRERKAMWVLVLAFGAVVFTYLGVNILPSASTSLHTYQ